MKNKTTYQLKKENKQVVEIHIYVHQDNSFSKTDNGINKLMGNKKFIKQVVVSSNKDQKKMFDEMDRIANCTCGLQTNSEFLAWSFIPCDYCRSKGY